ncbi:MAG: hypothetical protein GQ569_04470 [Methylococcaceae bacterium]|nr:hypothetical protein [Methylococcaceae bacterium]
MSNNQRLLQSEFKNLVPHAGMMLLIDEVQSWTENNIITRSHSHQNPDNPLRLNGKLSSLHLIEYGAQTMAIHCGLLTGNARAGFLAAVRAAHFYIDVLDDVESELIINATAELQMSKGAVYQFSVSDNDNNLLIEARTTVVHL